MKKRYLAVVFTCICVFVFLVACGSNNGSGSKGVIQIDEDTVNELVEGEKDGFFIAVSDKEESFFPILTEIAESEGVLVSYYYTYQPDGAEGEEVERQVFEATNKFNKNRLYYVKDGEIQQFIRLTSYTGLELQKQIRGFIENFTLYEE